MAKAWWAGAVCACWALTAPAQVAGGGAAQPAGASMPAGGAAVAARQAPAPAASAGARFLEACNQSLEKGVTDLGCQGPLYRNELERLKSEALTTQNPQLLSLVGNAYESQRAGFADVGQAYRWYLMAAVRGDPRAMQRLSEMNRRGSGVPQDKVKALGYARLAQRLGAPGSAAAAHDVAQTINELGTEMAAEEMALAERFALELESMVRRQSSGEPASGSDALPAPASGPARAVEVPPLPGRGLPGVPQHVAPGGAAVQPGTGLPGMPAPR